MSNPQDYALSLVQTRLYRLDGAVRQRVTELSSVYATVDFDLLFPSAPQAQATEQREMGFGASSMIINEAGHITGFKLRLPPLPKHKHQYAEVYVTVFRMAQSLAEQFHVVVRMRVYGGPSEIDLLWPHVEPAIRGGFSIHSPNMFMDFLTRLLNQYCERYEGGV